MGKNIDRLGLVQWAYLSEFIRVIDQAISEGRKDEAKLLAMLALNISHDPRKYPFDASLLRELNGSDFPLAMQFISRQRGSTASQWEDDAKDPMCDLHRLQRIAGMDN